MQIPVIPIDTVYHVGDFDRTAKGSRFSDSYEGSSLSVSLCPNAWNEIARLGGSECHALSREGALFLDVMACRDAYGLWQTMLEWALDQGLVEAATLWKTWSYDDETEEWRYVTSASSEDALQELPDPCDPEEYDPADHEAPEGHEAVEAFDTVVGTPALTDMTGMKLGADDPADDAVVMVYALVRLPEMGLHVDGLWWNETLDPQSLSAPRGGLFDGLEGSWSRTVVDISDVEDEELVADMSGTVWTRTTVAELSPAVSPTP